MANCFVLIENYVNGCSVQTAPVGVTLNAQYAYDWMQSEPPPFINREVREVPLYEVGP